MRCRRLPVATKSAVALRLWNGTVFVRQSSMGEFSAIEPAHSWHSRPRLPRFFGGRKTGTLLADIFRLVHAGVTYPGGNCDVQFSKPVWRSAPNCRGAGVCRMSAAEEVDVVGGRQEGVRQSCQGETTSPGSGAGASEDQG